MAANPVEQQARMLARDNREAEPTISAVYWFPDDKEVRLVELDPTVPVTDDGAVHPYYFRASPQDNLRLPSAIAIIRTEEFGQLRLPRTWGDWDRAILLEGK